MIEISGLFKRYRIHRRPPGLMSAVRSLVHRKYETVTAVDNLSVKIADGERTGFLGPNGAGKTTTLKMLSGLLHPSAGTARINGFNPVDRKREFLRSIMFVAGQKQQLVFDLPPNESFELNRVVYDIPSPQFLEMKAELVSLLDVGHVIDRPTRILSLGERMKCELVAALLHRPKILFLDEPTIGLDATMQLTIRDFLKTYNQRYGATILLTSHYMADIEAVCQRALVINAGRLVYDGTYDGLARSQNTSKILSLWFGQPISEQAVVEFIEQNKHAGFGETARLPDGKTLIEVARDQVGPAITLVMAKFPIADIGVADPPIEHVLAQLFARSRTRPTSEDRPERKDA
ncbi:MAG: ATP-binding cassette domain-containing protein [Deltaproteobacteria bacterium]|nr:ATP-binding cassette domain-containing protein [Deltaproteobacteria bacterium]